MDYKEEIEKEAKEYADKTHPEQMPTFRHYSSQDFISGVNSNIAHRIKVEYAIDVIEQLKKNPSAHAYKRQYKTRVLTSKTKTF